MAEIKVKKAAKKKAAKKKPKRALRRDGNHAMADAGGARIGRPRREFEPETALSIVETISRDGLDWATASHLHSVHEQVCSRWMVENEGFALAIKKARAEDVRNLLIRLRDLPAGQWTKAAWELERKYPSRFGQNQRIEMHSSAKLEITGAVCSQLSESWVKFRSQVIDAEQVDKIKG